MTDSTSAAKAGPFNPAPNDEPARADEHNLKRLAANRLKTLWAAEKISGAEYESGLKAFAVNPTQEDWQSFLGRSFSFAGALLLVAAALMFLAWNWLDMPKLLKFLAFELVFACCAMAAIIRWGRWSGQTALLAAGLLTGALLALYGQVYQTGADSWELFRAWSIALVPLFLLGRTSALGFLLWLTGTLWWFTFMFRGFDFEYLLPMRQLFWDWSFMLLQLLAWLFCEALYRFSQGRRQTFDPHRWLTRLLGAMFIFCITGAVAWHLFLGPSMWRMTSYGSAYSGGLILVETVVYLLALAGIFIFYYRRRPDIFFVTLGVFSLTAMLCMAVIHNLFENIRYFDLGMLLLSGLLIIGACILAGALIFKARKNIDLRLQSAGRNQNAAQDREDILNAWLAANTGLDLLSIQADAARSRAERAMAQPWYMKIPMILGIWLGSLLVLGFLAVLMFETLRGPAGLTMFGLALCAGGIPAFRSNSFAVRQLGLCLLICGLIFAGATVVESPAAGCLLYCCIFIGLWVIIPVFSARSVCFAAALAAGVILLLHLEDGWSYRSYARNGVDLIYSVALAAVFALITAAALVLGAANGKARKWSLPRWESLGAGCALIALGAAFMLPISPWLSAGQGAIINGPYYGIALGVLCAFVAVAVFLPRLPRPDPTANKEIPLAGFFAVICGLGLIFLLICRFSPAIALGLLLLVFAKSRNDRTLAGFAAFYAGIAVVFYYYNLDYTFLRKALVIGLTGAGVLGLGLAARFMAPFLGRLLAPAQNHRPARSLPGAKKAGAVAHGRQLLQPARLACLLVFVILLGGYNVSAYFKEALLRNGTPMVLKLAPVDPLSLLQGFYMELEFEAELQMRSALYREPKIAGSASSGGKLLAVMKREGEIWVFDRLYAGSSSGRLANDEHLLSFRIRKYSHGEEVSINGSSFFFEEGYAGLYERAAYAELRVAEDGASLISLLRDGDMRVIDKSVQ